MTWSPAGTGYICESIVCSCTNSLSGHQSLGSLYTNVHIDKKLNLDALNDESPCALLRYSLRMFIHFETISSAVGSSFATCFLHSRCNPPCIQSVRALCSVNSDRRHAYIHVASSPSMPHDLLLTQCIICSFCSML